MKSNNAKIIPLTFCSKLECLQKFGPLQQIFQNIISDRNWNHEKQGGTSNVFKVLWISISFSFKYREWTIFSVILFEKCSELFYTVGEKRGGEKFGMPLWELLVSPSPIVLTHRSVWGRHGDLFPDAPLSKYTQRPQCSLDGGTWRKWWTERPDGRGDSGPAILHLVGW